MTSKFCETFPCKYCRNSENTKFNKIIDSEREKAKKGLEKSTNFAKNAKVTKVSLFNLKRVGNKYRKNSNNNKFNKILTYKEKRPRMFYALHGDK